MPHSESYFVSVKDNEVKPMTTMDEAKKFARWLILNTKDVDTIGACRRYKNIIYNVDELYDIYLNLLSPKT